MKFLTILTLLPLVYAFDLCTYYSHKRYNDLKIDDNIKNLFSDIPLGLWYTDRDDSAISTVKDVLNVCDKLATIIVIYGLPNKDCGAGFSSGGRNKNTEDYIKFITDIHETVADRDIIYILEPDAIGLSKDGCGASLDYMKNINVALEILSKNKNAKIFIEIGYWHIIFDERQLKEIVELLKTLKGIYGIASNVSNYRKTSEILEACKKINQISGNDYKCLIDTSRNYNGPSPSNQWCNSKSGGIGDLPDITNDSINVWIKPQFELDGPCVGMSDSFEVPNGIAGGVNLDYFNLLLKNGNKEILQCLA